MKRLVVRRRPYGPPLTANRPKNCFMLTKESKRNLKTLVMELGSQPVTQPEFIDRWASFACVRKKR